MEEANEANLILYADGIVRRGTRLLRDDSNDQGALREAQRSLNTVTRTVRNINAIRPTADQDALLLRLVGVREGIDQQIASQRQDRRRNVVERALVRRTGINGRPRLDIQLERDIQPMINARWTSSAMAEALGVSRRTVMRRLASMGVRLQPEGVSDAVARNEVIGLRRRMPGAGVTVLRGHMAFAGIPASRRQVRTALREVDPYGSAQRQSRVIVRRRYYVAGPRALYHMDDTNNTAATVKAGYLSGVAKYGIPSRLRTDRGMENKEAALWQIQAMGVNRGSVIVGKSVHNQRIERWWRDLTRVVSSWYKRLFIQMEHLGIFNISSRKQLMVLHYIYLPRISDSISTFVNSWNHHPIRTEDFKSPVQLWEDGRLNGSLYGEDWNGQDVEDDAVRPSDLAAVYPDDWELLKSQFNPMEEDNNCGVTLFIRCKRLLNI